MILRSDVRPMLPRCLVRQQGDTAAWLELRESYVNDTTPGADPTTPPSDPAEAAWIAEKSRCQETPPLPHPEERGAVPDFKDFVERLSVEVDAS